MTLICNNVGIGNHVSLIIILVPQLDGQIGTWMMRQLSYHHPTGTALAFVWARDVGLGLCRFRFQKNCNSDSLTVLAFFPESIPKLLAKRIVKWMNREVIIRNGNRNWDSQFLILRNRHSTTLDVGSFQFYFCCRWYVGDDSLVGDGPPLRADHPLPRLPDPRRAQAPPLQEHRPLRPQAGERPPLLGLGLPTGKILVVHCSLPFTSAIQKSSLFLCVANVLFTVVSCGLSHKIRIPAILILTVRV